MALTQDEKDKLTELGSKIDQAIKYANEGLLVTSIQMLVNVSSDLYDMGREDGI